MEIYEFQPKSLTPLNKSDSNGRDDILNKMAVYGVRMFF